MQPVNAQSVFSDKELSEFVRNVYKGAYKNGAFDKKRVSIYAKYFSGAISDAFGDSAALDFDSPDAAMIQSLRSNVFHFSAAKNRSEIVSLSALLRDAKGKLRPFKEFKVEASKVVDEYQGAWLRTEYDTAVNSATLAARWGEFEDDDVLVFRTAGDSRVREEHRLLDGIAKPKTDKFWDIYYPPLSWNCRCTIETTQSGRVTADEQIPPTAIDGVPKMFRGNFAKEGVLFPPNHPYYKSNNGTVLNAEQQKALRSKRTAYKNGTVIENELVAKQNKKDYESVKKFANELAQQEGGVIEMLPILEDGDILREWLYQGAKGNTSPDFKINGIYADLKTLTKPSTAKYLRLKIKDCLKQGDIAVLQTTDYPNMDLLKEVTEAKLNGEKRLKAVYIQLPNGNIISYNKK